MADYVGGADPTDPRISPQFAELRGVAPLLIQTGEREVALDSAARFVSRRLGG